MLQLGSWDEWSDSSFLSFEAQAYQTFFEISDGLNMSYFEHYRHYSGNGGECTQHFGVQNPVSRS